MDDRQARAIYQYLVRNNYVDEEDRVTQDYRDDVQNNTLAPVPEALKPIEEGVHALVQAIYDDSLLKKMFEDGNKPKVLDNPLNERFEKEEFQKLWKTINHKYAYTVDFDSDELISKAIAHIDNELYVSQLQYTVTYAGQKDVISADMVREGSSFNDAKSKTTALKHAHTSQVPYDLIGKIAEGTVLTRRTVAKILQGIRPDTFAMYRNNPEEFITKVIRLIKEQKATMIVEHITYERYAEGRLQRDIYLMERDKLNAESDSLTTEKERLEKELLTLSQSRNRELTETCDMARRTLTADELTNEMLLFFIDRVNVYSGMRVEIIYRFSDEIARLIGQENTAE